MCNDVLRNGNLHISVMPDVILDLIKQFTKIPIRSILDCTFGFGGYIKYIAPRLGNDIEKITGIDCDLEVLQYVEKNKNEFQKLCQTFDFHCMNFANFAAQTNEVFDVVFLDLGPNNQQMLPENHRGFSFNDNLSLDMRLDTTGPVTAAHIINSFPRDKLLKIISEFEDPFYANKIVDVIYLARKKSRIQSAMELANLISQVCPFKIKNGLRVHPATKTLMALRIYVNKEIDNIIAFLNNIDNIAHNQTTVFFVTFHSTEDRVVKNWCKSSQNWKLIHKHVPHFLYARANRHARSAKIRVLQKQNSHSK